VSKLGTAHEPAEIQGSRIVNDSSLRAGNGSPTNLTQSKGIQMNTVTRFLLRALLTTTMLFAVSAVAQDMHNTG